MIHPPARAASHYVETRLRHLIRSLENALDADVLTFHGELLHQADDWIRDTVEAIDPRRPRLAFIVQTSGGFIEVVQRIVDTIRKHYAEVDFIVPNFAMSAGTVLVMSGDRIFMDYYSVLGPIDPQVEQQDSGRLVPALGYLIKYERLLKKARRGRLSTIEANILLNFDQAELYRYEQARNLSITLLKDWLVRYKFKNWTRTATRKRRVTHQTRVKRAEDIAKSLNDSERWHSHGRGLSMEVVRRELNLLIDDFETQPDLNQKIRNYHRLLVDYLGTFGTTGVLHTKRTLAPILHGEPHHHG